jgi:choline dehydrogenase
MSWPTRSSTRQRRLPQNPDFNGAVQEGFGYKQMTIRDGRRESTATAFLAPARSRANLRVETEALATRVLFDGRRATGVEFSQRGQTKRLVARREVILCGGAMNSPQLLQLSGVGPASLLQSHGIPVVEDLPGVGENLQDHFVVPITYRSARPVTINDIVNDPVKRTLAGLRYLLFRTGPLAANASLCGGCVRTDPSLPAPDVKINLQLWNRAKHGRDPEGGPLPFPAFGTNVAAAPSGLRTHPARNDGPSANALQLFRSAADQRAAVEGLKILRRIMAMPASRRTSPGVIRRRGTTDDELLAYCRQRGRSNHHAAGSCKMGPMTGGGRSACASTASRGRALPRVDHADDRPATRMRPR